MEAKYATIDRYVSKVTHTLRDVLPVRNGVISALVSKDVALFTVALCIELTEREAIGFRNPLLDIFKDLEWATRLDGEGIRVTLVGKRLDILIARLKDPLSK